MDTEKPISKDVVLHTYVVQSICLGQLATEKAYFATMKSEALPPNGANIPEWMQNFAKYSTAYQCLRGIELGVVDLGVLRQDLQDGFCVQGKTSLAGYIEYDGVTYHLLFDYGTLQWFLIYRIPLRFSLKDLKCLIAGNEESESSSEGGLKNDLYNCLRDIFVVSDNSDNPSKWVQSVEAQASTKIIETLGAVYGIAIEEKEVTVVETTGNVSLFFRQEQGTESDIEALGASLRELHARAERLDLASNKSLVESPKLYLFGGRFHTIIAETPNEELHYMSIQFHAQYLWCCIAGLGCTTSEIENEILTKSSKEKGRENPVYIDAVINSIQNLLFVNAKFKRSIEVDNEKIFSPIEKRWGLGQALLQLDIFSQHLSGYLERRHQRQIARFDQKQNKILFLISLLQLAALLSVWGDYVTMLNKVNAAGVIEVGFWATIFGDVSGVQAFNAILPLLIILIGIVAIIYVMFSRGKK